MATTEKTIKITERFLYIKCSKNVIVKRFGKPVATIMGGAAYRICTPAMMDYIVGDVLTLECDAQDNVEIVQSNFGFESIPVASSKESSTVPVVDLTTLETNSRAIATSTETTSNKLTNTNVTISEIATELSAFRNDFNLNNGTGEGGTPISMIPTNEKLQKIIGGLNQLQKISINVPKKFETALLSSDSSSVKLVAFDTLLPQDVNLYYMNNPIKVPTGSNTMNIKFLGGIHPQGNFSVRCAINSESAITEVVGKTDGDSLTFNVGKQITSIEWISLVGINA